MSYPMIPRYVYNPKRVPPPQADPETMEQLRRLYLYPEKQKVRDVRPVSEVEGRGLDEVRSFRGRRI